MVDYRRGNLFQSEMQTLVNAVNTVGVMGKGLALQFKKRYPAMFGEYQEMCQQETLTVGSLHLFKADDHWILNFPTKRHYRAKSKLPDIEVGLAELRRRYDEWGIESLALPALGCGLGGLDWNEVRPLIENYLGDLPIPIEVYMPRGADESEEEKDRNQETPVQGSLFDDDTTSLP